MLSVYCVYWGNKYHKGYVYALKDMVGKYLTVEHEFKCISTDKFDGIIQVTPYVPYSGWWQKIGLFAPRIATGPSLYFDLDIVITGNIDYLVDYTQHKFAAPANWAASGHGGIQSSVMAWSGNWFEPYEKFSPRWPAIQNELWGDQEFLWQLLGDDWVRIPGVCSYKYHCRDKGHKPLESNIIVFHGKPDPHEVNDKWLLPYTQTLDSHIKYNTRNQLNRGLTATG